MENLNEILRTLSPEQMKAVDQMNSENLEVLVSRLKFDMPNPLKDLLDKYNLKVISK